MSNLVYIYVNHDKLIFHECKEDQILKILAKTKDIVIWCRGKYKGTVISNKDRYINKLFDIITKLMTLQSLKYFRLNNIERKKITIFPKKI